MENSQIQWTDHTFNPWIGCTKVAPECKFCYAEEQQDHRYGRVKWGKDQPRSRTSEENWNKVYKWNREAEATGERKRVFCASLADVFDEEVDYQWRYDLWNLIQDTVWLNWLLLTKRPQNVAPMIAELAVPICEQWDCEGIYPSNVWLGVSAGVSPVPLLKVPSAVHFLSCEPMLHAMDETHAAEFDWIIFGGESGKSARECSQDWIRKGIEFCRRNDVRPFVKQLGSNSTFFNHAGNIEYKADLKDSHGGQITEWPEDLQVRESPK